MGIKKMLLLLPLLSLGYAYAQGSGAEGEETAQIGHSSQAEAPKQARNILSVTPIQLIENNYGLGLSIEHFTGKKQVTSLGLLVFSSFYKNNGEATGTKKTSQVLYVAPELKFYISKPGKTIRYALGPSLIAGMGEDIISSTSNLTPYSVQRVLLGILVNNSINICPSPKVYYGFDVGAGFTYVNIKGEYEVGTRTLIHGGLKIGYRF